MTFNDISSLLTVRNDVIFSADQMDVHILLRFS